MNMSCQTYFLHDGGNSFWQESQKLFSNQQSTNHRKVSVVYLCWKSVSVWVGSDIEIHNHTFQKQESILIPFTTTARVIIEANITEWTPPLATGCMRSYLVRTREPLLNADRMEKVLTCRYPNDMFPVDKCLHAYCTFLLVEFVVVDDPFVKINEVLFSEGARNYVNQ